ncbi:MAG TPA: DUF4010 domain-containing protein [Acetobacteraceae bacterium]|nr:DUF4010 domain-containing protein [Acetobacteraceae bacterium]
MNHNDVLYRLAIAVACGLLVGVERHWRERDGAPGSRIAGVRSFVIIGLMGGLFGALSAQVGREAGALLLGLSFLGLTASVLALRLREAAEDHTHSVTGVLAAQATFAIGAVAMLGDARAAGAAAVGLTALLAARGLLHGFVRQLRWAELRSGVLLLSMTFVALPLVPDRPFGVLLGLNPAQVWRFAIVLAAVSFAGYIAVRLLGQSRGQLLAGGATGLVSSTAATLTLARRSRETDAPATFAAGALAAGAVSWLRTGALAWWVAPSMARLILPALLAGAVVQGGAALVQLRRDRGGPDEAPTENPFRLAAVLRLALLLAAVALAAAFAARHFGGYGLGLVAAVTALADVDAVTLSMGNLVRESLSPALGAQTVGIAVAANTVAKAAYAATLGSRGYAWRFVAASAAALLAGLAALLLS